MHSYWCGFRIYEQTFLRCFRAFIRVPTLFLGTALKLLPSVRYNQTFYVTSITGCVQKKHTVCMVI